MTRKQFFFGLAVFCLCSCFIVDFTNTETRWIWEDNTTIPIGLGLLSSCLFFYSYHMNSHPE